MTNFHRGSKHVYTNETGKRVNRETGKRVFPAEFKRDALDLVERSGTSLAQVARELGISENTLHGWKQQMRVHGHSWSEKA